MSAAEIGAIVAAAGLVPLLGSADRRLRLAGLALLAVGYTVLAIDALHSPIANLRVDATDRPLLAAVAVAAGLAGVALGALAAIRWPVAVLFAAVATASVRVPVHMAGEDAKLLVPLYAVVAVIFVVSAYELVVGRARPPALGSIGWLAGAFILWTAASLIWSADRQQGAVQLLFFYLPFGLLLAHLATLRPRLPDLRRAVAIQIGLALVFAGVAFWQYQTKQVFWKESIIVGNQYAAYFRVNSLFYDSSMFGRYMAVAILVLAGIAVFRRLTIPIAVLIAAIFAGLYLSYSQSSLLALALGALVLGAFGWRRRLVLGIVATCVVIGLAGLAVSLRDNSGSDVSRERSTLVEYAWGVIERNPVIGAGIGGHARDAAAHTDRPLRIDRAASHTTPVTVLAELGPLGLGLFVALLGSIALRALRAQTDRLPRLTMLAALAAIATSSLSYNAYFEDPATWILTALIATVTLAPRPRTEAPA